MRFFEWAKRQPRGVLKRIELEHGVGYNTLSRLMRGETLTSYLVAKRVSAATGGEVSIEEICEPPKRTSRRP